MRLLRRRMGPAIIMLALALLLGATTEVQAQADAGYLVPVTGEPIGFDAQGVFFGDLLITRFDNQRSTLLLIGVLDNYRYVEGEKSTIGNIRRDLALPITDVAGGCEGVTLTLEPLTLGGEFPPEIFLDPVALGDNASGGADDRIGKLLCRVGKLGENEAPAAALAVQLNQLLRALRG